MYYVYVLKKINRFYIGYTADLKRRLAEHKKRNDGELIYYEAYISKKQALLREERLKFYGGAWRSLKRRLKL